MELFFAQVETTLAEANEIAPDKRSAFANRLKHLQKLGFPEGTNTGRGRAATYSVGHLVQLAIAVEFAQLGLLPERLINVFRLNTFPIAQAVSLAAGFLLECPNGFNPDGPSESDPTSMFLYFDPSALAPLMGGDVDAEDQASATLFYSGGKDLADNLVTWTTGVVRRLALLNVTSMLWDICRDGQAYDRAEFLNAARCWADDTISAYLTGPDPAHVDALTTMQTGLGFRVGMSRGETVDQIADQFENDPKFRLLKGDRRKKGRGK